MLDVKVLRNHFDEVKEKLTNRNEDISALDKFGELDEKRRQTIQEVEESKSRRNKVSQEISQM